MASDPSEFNANRPWYFNVMIALSIIVGAFLAVAAGMVLYRAVWEVLQFDGWPQIIREHFRAIVGLPCSAALAFAFVLFLRNTGDPIEFSVLGFWVKGAAGPGVMWIFFFLAMVLGIRLLW